MNDTGSRPMEHTLQTKRIRRGVYGLSGTVTFNDAMSKYTCEMLIAYSAKNDNAFMRSPISVAEGRLCDKLNKEYRKYMMKPLADASDLPNSEKGDMCELIEQVGDTGIDRLYFVCVFM